MNVLEFEGVLSPHALRCMQHEDGHNEALSLADWDLGDHVPVFVRERRREREDIVMHCDATCNRHGRVQAESFAHNEVEVRERVQVFHRRRVSRYGEELLTELLLHLGVLAQREETPTRRCARRLVTRNEESGNL